MLYTEIIVVLLEARFTLYSVFGAAIHVAGVVPRSIPVQLLHIYNHLIRFKSVAHAKLQPAEVQLIIQN